MDSPSSENSHDELVAGLPFPKGLTAGASLTVAKGDCVTLWCGADVELDTFPECKVRIAPDRPAVVGRSEGHAVPYLDPRYRPTRLVPGSGQDIMRSGGGGFDRCVSRGHFMLMAAARGILLVNGVPRAGGGIRAPRNGTRLISPQQRPMNPAEEYLIESGATVAILLPNGSEVRIGAE